MTTKVFNKKKSWVLTFIIFVFTVINFTNCSTVHAQINLNVPYDSQKSILKQHINSSQEDINYINKTLNENQDIINTMLLISVISIIVMFIVIINFNNKNKHKYNKRN